MRVRVAGPNLDKIALCHRDPNWQFDALQLLKSWSFADRFYTTQRPFMQPVRLLASPTAWMLRWRGAKQVDCNGGLARGSILEGGTLIA